MTSAATASGSSATAIDLNCDLGEEIDGLAVADDAALLGLVSSANVACGFHAGTEQTMRDVCRLAARFGVSVGAHPSYRDRAGFGRRSMEISPSALEEEVLEQIDTLHAIARESGSSVRYIKPHGALYNRIAVDPVQAAAVARAARAVGLPLLGPADSVIEESARHHGVNFFAEAFADRAYLPDGQLAPRAMAGAVLVDPEAVADRVIRLLTDGTIIALDGSTIAVRAQSICIHSDTSNAVELATAVRARLDAAGVEIAAFA